MIWIQVFTCKKLLMTKKKLPVRFTGQHFTIDKVLIKDAIRQANISNQDTVLDIGAGKGFLTVHLKKLPTMLLLLKTTQLWLNIYENYFLMPEMFKLSVVILGILQFRNFLSKWCQIFLMALLPIFSKSWCLRILKIFWEVPLSFSSNLHKSYFQGSFTIHIPFSIILFLIWNLSMR